MQQLGIERLAEGLREQTKAFSGVVRGMDPERRVPTCPQWRVRDLVAHIGQAHRWAAGIVRAGAAEAVPDPRDVDPGAPGAWPRWLADGVTDLVTAVRGTPPEATVWTFLGAGPAVFWLRRMLHDTCVHHADAALASDTAFRVAPDLAADAICELLDLLCAPGAEAVKPALAELRGHGERLQLQAKGPAAPGWVVTRTAQGPTWERGPAAADVAVTGTVQDLLLLLHRRLSPTAVTITGDRALLDHWLTHTAL